MKTTVDIADSLLARAKNCAHSRHTTLRAVIEEGLVRTLAEEEKAKKPFRLRPVVMRGGGLQPEFADGDWGRIRAEIYRGRGT